MYARAANSLSNTVNSYAVPPFGTSVVYPATNPADARRLGSIASALRGTAPELLPRPPSRPYSRQTSSWLVCSLRALRLSPGAGAVSLGGWAIHRRQGVEVGVNRFQLVVSSGRPKLWT